MVDLAAVMKDSKNVHGGGENSEFANKSLKLLKVISVHQSEKMKNVQN